jgi:ABC-type uncharacterized transport system YnjBCD permease subunit
MDMQLIIDFVDRLVIGHLVFPLGFVLLDLSCGWRQCSRFTMCLSWHVARPA